MRIQKLFKDLTEATLDHTYTIVQIPNRNGIFLGIDAVGRPCLFISGSVKILEPMLRTARLSLCLNRNYCLSFPDSSKTKGIFHALVCESTERDDTETFLSLVEIFLAQNIDLTSISQNLVSFFRSMARLFAINPARDLKAERQGLWGELFLMGQIRGFQFWAPFWHGEVRQLFDFSTLNKHLEVKTTIGNNRIHHFSHRQLYPLQEEEIIVASLLVVEDEKGLSLRELIEDFRSVLFQTPFCLKLEKAVRHAGMDDSSEVGPKFDSADAKLKLGWFHSADIPHFRVPEPPGVSQTSYRVDLSEAPQLGNHELNVWLDSWSIIKIE
jgi:hypothetical protein